MLTLAFAFLGRFKWYFIGALALGLVIWFGYAWIDKTIATIKEQARVIAQQEIVIKSNELVQKSLQENLAKQNEVLQNLFEEMQKAGIPEAQIQKFFSETNLTNLAETNPEKVKEILDQQEADVQRCFEIASGSPVVETDKANTVCPDLVQ